MSQCEHMVAQLLGMMGEDYVFYCLACDSYWSEDGKEFDFPDTRKQFTLPKV